MSTSGIQWRPLGVGDLVDETIRLYRRNFRLVILVGAPIFVLFIILGLISQLLVPRLLGLSYPAFVWLPASFGDYMGGASQSALENLLVAVFVSAVIVGLLHIPYFIAMTYAMSEAALGRSVSVGQAYKVGVRRFLPILVLIIKILFVSFVLSVFIVTIPVAIYFMIAWMFAFHALILEGKGITSSTRRSRALVRGHWWRVVGTILVVFTIIWILQMMFEMLVGTMAFAAFVHPSGLIMDATAVVAVISDALTTVVLFPILCCSLLLLYYDLRVRKEGFDIELMADQMTNSLRPSPVME